MRLKILTANIALGVSTKGLQGLRAIIAFHNWKSLPYLLFRGNTFCGLIKYEASPRKKRVEFFSRRSSLEKTIELIKSQQSDIVVLNEVLLQIHKEELEKSLRDLGFTHIEWGLSKHYEDLTIATVIASKLPCLGFMPEVEQLYRISGGAGVAGIRLREIPISFIGCHLTYGRSELSKKQIDDLAHSAELEIKSANSVLIAGDFNETAENISRVEPFNQLSLKSVTTRPTCPLNLPAFLRSDLDHVFVPKSWKVQNTQYIAFGSDHFAISTEVIF
jgi:endonuclease/exonuclease/phosphatase family metal-dependent hydrolase